MDDETLIEQVRMHSVLYDVTSFYYRTQINRNAAWREIGERMQLPAERCKYEWKKLRSCFLSALRRRHRLNSSSPTTKDISPWKFTQQMEFLLPYLEHRTTYSNLIESTTTHVETHGLSSNMFDDIISNISTEEIEEVLRDTQNEAESVGLHSYSRKNKRNDNSLEIDGIMKVDADLHGESMYESNISEQHNDVELFYSSMAKIAKRLPKIEETKLRLKVCKIVTEAELGYLEKRSHQQYNFPGSSTTFHLLLKKDAYSQISQPLTSDEDMFKKPNSSRS